MNKSKHISAILSFAVLIFGLNACNKEESPSSPTSAANCVFTKHQVQETQSGQVGQPVTYTINHFTTVKNSGTADANDVKIVVYVNGSSVSSVNVIGLLRPGQSANKDFQTVTVGVRPELKITWD